MRRASCSPEAVLGFALRVAAAGQAASAPATPFAAACGANGACSNGGRCGRQGSQTLHSPPTSPGSLHGRAGGGQLGRRSRHGWHLPAQHDPSCQFLFSWALSSHAFACSETLVVFKLGALALHDRPQPRALSLFFWGLHVSLSCAILCLPRACQASQTCGCGRRAADAPGALCAARQAPRRARATARWPRMRPGPATRCSSTRTWRSQTCGRRAPSLLGDASEG